MLKTRNHSKYCHWKSQFLLNRIANLVRDNAIDYSEYYSDNLEETGGGTAYAQDVVPENDDRKILSMETNPKNMSISFTTTYPDLEKAMEMRLWSRRPQCI